MIYSSAEQFGVNLKQKQKKTGLFLRFDLNQSLIFR